MNNWLLIDIGNSFLKVATPTNTGVLGEIHYETMQQLRHRLPLMDGVMVSSVASDSELSIIQDICEEHGVQCLVPSKSRVYSGVTYAYQNINALGLDRWINIYAAHHLYRTDCIVISAGTAITADFIRKDGTHLGGWIAPGYQTMAASLLKNTAKIDAKISRKPIHGLGDNTQRSIDGGCLAALSGFVNSVLSESTQYFGQPKLIITGGDRDLVSICYPDQICVENLVLEGLLLLLKRRLDCENDPLCC